MSTDFLLHESAVGYAVSRRTSKEHGSILLTVRQIFKVVMQPDSIGNRLEEVQKKAQDLAHFGTAIDVAKLIPCICD